MRRYDHDQRFYVRNGRVKFFVATGILILVLVGLNTTFFASLGILDFQTTPTFADFEIRIHELNLKLNGAQQGVHFLEGMVTSLIFAHPLTGFSFGFLKELFDFGRYIKKDSWNRRSFADGLLDLSFWTLGGFAGFYAMIPLHGFLIKNQIRKLRDLVGFIRRGSQKK